MFFDIDHNVEEVERWNVARSIWIFAFKCFFGMLLVEIVQQLREFGICDSSGFVLMRRENWKINQIFFNQTTIWKSKFTFAK